jgi:4-diphosphocytidyl-2-C-methyl-D-erythritol kinase
MHALVEAAPAKVNLALHVVGRRTDRYHLLDSLVVFADVADELTAEPAPADTLRVTGPFAEALGGGGGNLVTRAVAAFRAHWPEAVATGLALTLAKNLPVAAGLGGGSADAAAALRLLAGLSDVPIPAAELMALAATLGADVPMCLLSRPCLVGGIGEAVSPLPAFPPTHLVLVNPLQPVVTAEIFRRLASHENPGLPPLPEPLSRPAQLGLWLEETRNDLEPVARALVPAIGPLIDWLAARPGCMLARMSGSGATVFGLFGSGALAHQAAHDLRAAHPGFWVAAAPVLGVNE